MPIDDKKANDEAQIRDLIDRFAKAFRAKDVNGVMAPFAHQIVSFDIVPLKSGRQMDLVAALDGVLPQDRRQVADRPRTRLGA